MLNQFSRTQLLIGADAIKKLSESRVAVFGIGGVGGYVCECVSYTDKRRRMCGCPNYDSILPGYDGPENADDFPFDEYDYVIDAVDTVTAKLELIMRCKSKNIPVISAMGAGNKLDAGRMKIADIYETSVCPLARVMRHELRKRGVKKLKVVYSDEQPIRPLEDMSISCRSHCICPPGAQHKCTERRDIPGSTAFVPAVAGLLIAGEVVKDLTVI